MFVLGFSFGQYQHPIFTNENWMEENPAAAGITKLRTFYFLHHDAKVEGNQGNSFSNVAFGMPIRFNSMGVGAQFSTQKSSMENVAVRLNYNYKIRIAKGKLSFGMQPVFYQFKTNPEKYGVKDWADLLLDQETYSFVDLGVGLFYYTNKLFVSVGVQNLITRQNQGYGLAKEFHWACGITVLDKQFLKLNAQVLYKKTEGIPSFLSFLLLLDYKNVGVLGIGGTQFGNINFQIKLRLNKIIPRFSEKISVGYAYEIPLQRREYENVMNQELMMRYDFGKRHSKTKVDQLKRVTSPTYFD